jgi:DNA-binding PadR family transcriptional regulator
MSLKLALLGLLCDKEMYGYEIHQILSRKHRNFMPVAVSSVYYQLDRLEKDALIVKRTESQKNRPDRNVYTITQKGRDGFQRFLTKNLKKEGTRLHEYDPFNVGVSLMRHIPREEARATFEKRLEMLTNSLTEHEKGYQLLLGLYEQEVSHHIDFYILTLMLRGISHIRAEKEWCEKALKMLDSSLYKEIAVTKEEGPDCHGKSSLLEM